MISTEPTAGLRRGVLVAAVLFVVLVVGTGALQLLSQAATGTYERTSTLTPTGERFTVASDAGTVTLSPSSDGAVHIRTVVRYGLGQPELTEETTSAGVRLDATCSGLLATHCDVDYAVELPPSFPVYVEGTAGDVTVSGLTGPVTVERATGDIALVDLAGPIDATVMSGVISGRGLRSDVVRAETRSGDVRLELREPPSSLAVDSLSGQIDVTVPATGYRVDARSTTGEASVLVPVDAAAPGMIVLDSENGDVRVRPSL
ncbi:DUF4097 family beta strand repeat-containing protein [Pseudonocardia xinjiangensis]|uniref:DUF4097 family beta strand repeat-containing protein n=1 Tax=Pseudonocardia xinjiangensis TaxID=75289 RepID=UPI003D92AFA2